MGRISQAMLATKRDDVGVEIEVPRLLVAHDALLLTLYIPCTRSARKTGRMARYRELRSVLE
jgi:hypothetical protein